MSLWFIPTGGFGDDQPVPPPLITPLEIALKVTSPVGKALRYSEEEGGCHSGWENDSLRGKNLNTRRWIFSLMILECKIFLVTVENKALFQSAAFMQTHTHTCGPQPEPEGMMVCNKSRFLFFLGVDTDC